jgi:hypothetical protein
MKLLLDENLPHQLRLEIEGHDVSTVAYMGWSGIENGELLNRAAEEGFDALLTNDRGIEHERHADSLPIAVVVLHAMANTIEQIRPLYPELHRTLKSLRPRTLVNVGQ